MKLALLLVGAFIFASTLCEAFDKYLVVVDAGSSGSRIKYFKCSIKPEELKIAEVNECKLSNPLTDIVKFKTKILTDFHSCLSDPKNKDFRDNRATFYLAGTAGLRLFVLSNEEAVQQAFSNVKEISSVLNYDVGPASSVAIMSGEDEGINAWVTINYFNGFFLNKASQSLGAIDMGGASLQISFIPDASEQVPVTTVTVLDDTYDIFSVSFLCYGSDQNKYRFLAEEIQKRPNEHEIENHCGINNDLVAVPADVIFGSPCVSGSLGESVFGSSIQKPDNAPRVYSVLGTGNRLMCQTLLSKFLMAPSMKNVNLPKMQGNFLAISSFTFSVSDMKLPQVITKKEYENSLDDLCTKSNPVPGENMNNNAEWPCGQLCFGNIKFLPVH